MNTPFLEPGLGNPGHKKHIIPGANNFWTNKNPGNFYIAGVIAFIATGMFNLL